MHECCSTKVPKSNVKHWTKSIKGLCHRSELIWLTFEHQSAPEKLCTRRRDICEFDVERYLLNFANLLRMSVAWKLFQEHYHYFLRAEIRRRKVATNPRCWVFFNSFVRFWGSTFSGYSHFISEMVRTKTRAALKGRVDQYQVWTCLLPRICIPALKLLFLIGTNKFYNADKYILQVVQMQL